MIHPYKGQKPEIDDSTLVVESAQIIGDVKIGEESSALNHTLLSSPIRSSVM